MRWCSDAGFGAFFCFEDFFDLFWLIESSAYADECAGDDAYHIVQEAVSTDVNGDFFSVPDNIEAVNRAYGVVRVGADIAEAFEIMCADEVIGRLLHFGFIQREGDMACGQAFQRIREWSVENVIFVVFGAVLISWMPVQRNFL